MVNCFESKTDQRLLITVLLGFSEFLKCFFLFQNLRACYEAGENEKQKRNIEYYPEDEDPDLSGLGAMSLHCTTDEIDYDPCDEYVLLT